MFDAEHRHHYDHCESRQHRHPKNTATESCRSHSSPPSAADTPSSLHSSSVDSPAVVGDATAAAAASRDTVREDESMKTLLDKFSKLEVEIKSLLGGENSLRDRIQLLGSRQESNKSVIRCLKDSQEGIRGRLDAMELQARQRAEYLNHLKKERMQSLAQATTPEPVDGADDYGSIRPSPGIELNQKVSTSSLENQADERTKLQPQHLKRIINCWDENNCDLHLRRLVQSSRQIAAYEILAFAHKRLSTHLINHISETSKGLTGDDKTRYLASFIKDGPFQSKAIGEGTYADLLKFVEGEQVQRPSKDLQKALKAAEDNLIEEAVRAGYRAYDIGDIRSQMSGFFTTATERLSGHCHPTPVVETEVTKDVVEDTERAANEGKLGLLQKASKLIKLGCYFLRWQLVADNQQR